MASEGCSLLPEKKAKTQGLAFPLLNLPDAVLGKLAEIGECHQELRGTCKRLRQTCDLARTSLAVLDPSEAALQPSAFKRWPALKKLSVFNTDSRNVLPWKQPASVWGHMVLAAVMSAGLQLTRFEVSYGEMDAEVIAALVKTCGSQLEELVLSNVVLTGFPKRLKDELASMQLRELKWVEVRLDYPGPDQAIQWPQLFTFHNTQKLQDLALHVDGKLNVEAWSRFGANLGSLKALTLLGDVGGFGAERAVALLGSCTSLQRLEVDPYAQYGPFEKVEAAMLVGLNCLGLRDFRVNCSITLQALDELLSRCKNLNSLSFELSSDDEAFRPRVVDNQDGFDKLGAALSKWSKLNTLDFQLVDKEPDGWARPLMISGLLRCLSQVPNLAKLSLCKDVSLAAAAHVNIFAWQLPKMRQLYLADSPSQLEQTLLVAANALAMKRGLTIKVDYDDDGLLLVAYKDKKGH